MWFEGGRGSYVVQVVGQRIQSTDGNDITVVSSDKLRHTPRNLLGRQTRSYHTGWGYELNLYTIAPRKVTQFSTTHQSKDTI